MDQVYHAGEFKMQKFPEKNSHSITQPPKKLTQTIGVRPMGFQSTCTILTGFALRILEPYVYMTDSDLLLQFKIHKRVNVQGFLAVEKVYVNFLQ
jgi:hypothetical protein